MCDIEVKRDSEETGKEGGVGTKREGGAAEQQGQNAAM